MSIPTDPAARLEAAATRLRALATDATPGPWHRPLNTRRKCSVRATLPDGERGEWTNGTDPATGKRETCTVATIPIWSDGTFARKRSGRDLEYIAAMDPAVGLALADWLDRAARGWDALTKAAAQVLDPYDPKHVDAATILNSGPYDAQEALTLADAILGAGQ